MGIYTFEPEDPVPTVYTIYLQIHMDNVCTVYHKYWKIG